MLEVLRSGQLSLGPRVPAFEQAFAARVGAPHASAVSSRHRRRCTSRCARSASSDGDEVVTSPFSFVASANAILYERARPVFADIDPVHAEPRPGRGGGGDHASARRALLPVHIFGYPADMPGARARTGCRSSRTPARRSARVHADGTPVGGRGHPAAFGFYANKQLTTGEGGMLTLGVGRAQGARSTPSATRAARPTWAGSTTTGSASTTGSPTSRARSGSRSSSASTSMLADRARVAAAGTARRWPGIEGLELPCEDAGGDVRGWFVFVVQLPRGVDRDDDDRARCASAACSPSRTCRRST